MLFLALRSKAVIRVGSLPEPFVVPDYGQIEVTNPRSLRERVKHFIFSFTSGRALRRIVLFLRLPVQGRRYYSANWILLITRNLAFWRRDYVYWIGSDVQKVLLQVTDGKRPRDYVRTLNRSHNITGVDRLTDELSSIGVDATTVPFPFCLFDIPVVPPPMPATMTVLSYVPDSRREFYGLPSLLDAGKALPDVQFSIMGGDGIGVCNVPPNVRFFGFLDDPAPLYAKSSVVVRLVEHDGAGASVAEGLLFARPIIYSYPTPHVTHVPYGDSAALIEALSDLRQQHLTGGIPLNLEGRRWALIEFDPDRRFAFLYNVLVG
jgi:hypothetical protein